MSFIIEGNDPFYNTFYDILIYSYLSISTNLERLRRIDKRSIFYLKLSQSSLLILIYFGSRLFLILKF